MPSKLLVSRSHRTRMTTSGRFTLCVFENVKGCTLESLQGNDVTHATTGCVVFFYGKRITHFILKCNLDELLNISKSQFRYGKKPNILYCIVLYVFFFFHYINLGLSSFYM